MMDKDYAMTESLALIERSPIAMVGSVDGNAFPNIKAMMKIEHEDLTTIWFSTNTSSKRVAQFYQNPKACVYYVDQKAFKGLMLVGAMEVLQDEDIRRRFWQPGCEVYYPLGVTDPDYSILRFTAEWGNFYYNLDNLTFQLNGE
jgi:general stress protein 26